MFLLQRFLEWYNKDLYYVDIWGDKRKRSRINWAGVAFFGFWGVATLGVVYLLVGSIIGAMKHDAQRTHVCSQKYGEGAVYYQLDISTPEYIAKAESYGIVVPAVAKERGTWMTTCQDKDGNIKQYPGRYDA